MSFFDIVLDFILMDAFEDLENPPSSVLAVLRNRWLSDSFKETVGGCPAPPHVQPTLPSPRALAHTLLSSIPGSGHQGWAVHPLRAVFLPPLDVGLWAGQTGHLPPSSSPGEADVLCARLEPTQWWGESFPSALWSPLVNSTPFKKHFF